MNTIWKGLQYTLSVETSTIKPTCFTISVVRNCRLFIRTSRTFGLQSGSSVIGPVVNLTTNVDDLLERAGVPKEDTLYIHGYLKDRGGDRSGSRSRSSTWDTVKLTLMITDGVSLM